MDHFLSYLVHQVFLFDESINRYRIHVLYKDILVKTIHSDEIKVTKSDLGLPGGKDPAVFADIHRRPLNYPDNCEGPYHRIMLYMAREAIRAAEECDPNTLVGESVIRSPVIWSNLKKKSIGIITRK